MSQEQRDAIDQMMRHAPLDLGGDVPEQPVNFEKTSSRLDDGRA
jgi:hypothetical protein